MTASERLAYTSGGEDVRRKASFVSASFEAEFWNEECGGKWCEGAKISLKHRKHGGQAVLQWQADEIAAFRDGFLRSCTGCLTASIKCGTPFFSGICDGSGCPITW